jgi:hypothetical protein
MAKMEARIRRLETARAGNGSTAMAARRIAAARAILAYGLGIPVESVSAASHSGKQRARTGEEIIAELLLRAPRP